VQQGCIPGPVRRSGGCPVKLSWCRSGRGPDDYVKLSHAILKTGLSPQQTLRGGCNNPTMTDAPAARRPLTLAILLIVTGALGWWASFALTIDKIAVLMNPLSVRVR